MAGDELRTRLLVKVYAEHVRELATKEFIFLYKE